MPEGFYNKNRSKILQQGKPLRFLSVNWGAMRVPRALTTR
jgi:hypothetical protein